MQKSSMAFVHLFEGFFRTIPKPAVRHPMISASCMTLMTMDNTRAVMTFMHMRNALPMLSSVRMKLLGIPLPLCLPHQVPQLTKVTHHKKQSYMQTIIDYVHLDARLDPSCRPVAPLLFVQASGGTGKSWMAREILKRMCGQYGNNVVKYVAPSGIAASNLNNGSPCHHGMGLKV